MLFLKYLSGDGKSNCKNSKLGTKLILEFLLQVLWSCGDPSLKNR